MTEDRATRMRSALFRMMAGILIVDAAALGVWFFTDVRSSATWRWPMLICWLLATLAVVLPGLRAVRIARRN